MRRSSEQQDSTELLLDTICNCLGAILFIVLLILLLATQRSAQAEKQPQIELSALRQRKLVAELALKQLRSRRDSLDEALRLATSAGDEKELMAEKVALIRELERQNRLVESGKARISESQGDLTRAKQEQEKLLKRIAGLKADIARLDERITKAKTGQNRLARLPRVRATSKGVWPVILRYGRLYPVNARDGLGRFNKTDLDVRDDGTRTWFTPRREKGIVILKSNKTSAAAVEYLKTVEGQQCYVGLYVYPDSYSEALSLRDEVLKAGLEYNWDPMQPTHTLSIGPGRGSNRVQ